MGGVFSFVAGASCAYRRVHGGLFTDPTIFAAMDEMWERWLRGGAPLVAHPGDPTGPTCAGDAQHYDGVGTTLKRVRFWDARRNRDPFRSEAAFAAYLAPVTLDTLDGWDRESETWVNISEKRVLLGRFADREGVMEPLEELVNEVLSELDRQTQLQLDAMRGK